MTKNNPRMAIMMIASSLALVAAFWRYGLELNREGTGESFDKTQLGKAIPSQTHHQDKAVKWAMMPADERPDKIAQPTRPAGAESPFITGGITATSAAEQTEIINLRAFIEQWQTARLEGRWDEAMAMRNRLLLAGASAIPLLFEPLHSGDPETECDTLRLLRQIGGPRATAMALGRVMSVPPEHEDYDRYLSTMKDFNSRMAADWLVRELGKTASQNIRETLLAMLAVMGGNQAVEAIGHGMRHARDPLHQRDLVTALLMRNQPSSIDALTSLLYVDEYRLPRQSAAMALARIGSREALLNIAEAAEYDDDERFALALEYADSAYAQETLLELALDAYWSTPVRASATAGLAHHGGYRVPTSLINALPGEGQPEVAAAMANTLQEIGRPSEGVTRQNEPTHSKKGELWF